MTRRLPRDESEPPRSTNSLISHPYRLTILYIAVIVTVTLIVQIIQYLEQKGG